MIREDENEPGNMSYWKGDDSEPLISLTIGQVLQLTAEKYPDRVAISVFHGPKLTYGEVLDEVDILASALANLGLKRGDHVALWGFNTIEWYLSFLAACRAGLVVVNLNPLYQSLELLTCLKQADVKALIMSDAVADRNFYDILTKAIPQVEQFDCNVRISSDEVPLLQTIVVMSKKSFKGTFKWSDLFSSVTKDEKMKITENEKEQSTFDVCNMQFTSGTTSDPKCVQLTHYSLINAANTSGKIKTLHEKPHRICVQVPFFHAYGTIHGILASVCSGCSVVLPSMKFSPNKSFDCIISEKCSVVYGTPTMYSDLLSVTRARAANEVDISKKLSSVEVFHSGGAMCQPQIMQELRKYFKSAQFMFGYGMTETSAVGFSTSLKDSLSILLSTAGRAAEHVEVKVIDNNGEMVPFGVPGELCCKGYNIMKGYYKDEVKTAEVLGTDGWIRTGDKFILMKNGYGEIVGRIKDIIIRGGENIAPKEIEQLLIQHPDITDVQVYGVNDKRLGEAVAAAVIKAPKSILNDRDVKMYCEGLIASYKIPQYVVFLDNFPKTASGKIQKVKLKEMTEKCVSI